MDPPVHDIMAGVQHIMDGVQQIMDSAWFCIVSDFMDIIFFDSFCFCLSLNKFDQLTFYY